MKLVFAQGNPESTYDRTRHNIGFYVLDKFAEGHNLTWSEKAKFNALITEVTLRGEKVILVKPTTFYNETSISARKLIDFYSLNTTTDILVIHDDLALPFGTIRIRGQGSDAGNNGIKSLNSHLGPDYHRIRIGIWNERRDLMNDADFVLSRFSKEESKKLDALVVPHVIERIEKFCQETLGATSHTL